MSDTKPQLLIDTLSFRAQLVEGNERNGGKLIARGEFARADVATENKRVYPHALWEREARRLAKSLAERKVYGELDHPMDGRTSLKRVSHMLTNLRLENGILVGEAEIMDTAEGRNLKAILAAGGKVGVSSRGFGTTRPNMKGEDVVQDDYRLMTFDFVAEPANVTSYPEIRTESKRDDKPAEAIMAEDVKTQNLEELKQSNPGLYEFFMNTAEREYEKRAAKIWAEKIAAAKDQSSTDLRAEFAEQLQANMAEMRKEVADQIRTEMLADPAVAGAKSAIEKVKEILSPFILPKDVESAVKIKEEEVESLRKRLAEQELKIGELQEQNLTLANLAKEAGYKYHLESLLHGHPQAKLVRRVVGDVKLYDSVRAIDEKVAAIAEELAEQASKKEERDHEMERLKEENEKLREASKKAVEATKFVALQGYVESRLQHHPKAKEMRPIIEARNPNSQADVDAIFAEHRAVRRDPDELQNARARVKELVGSGIEYVREDVETPRNRNNDNGYNGVPGATLTELRALAGIGDKH